MYRILFFMMTMLALGCATKKNTDVCPEATPQKIEYKIIQSISIDIDTMQYSFLSSHVLETDTGTFFIGFDNQKQAIDFYNLKSQKYVHSLGLDSQGPNAVEEPAAFYFHSADSIFISRYGYFQIYLVNSKGEKLNEWRFFDMQLPDSIKRRSDVVGTFGLGGFDQYGMNIFYLPESKELLTNIHITPLNEENSFPTTYELPILAKLDIITGKVVKLFGEFPPEYFGSEIPHDLFTSYAIGPDKIAISFLSSPRVMVAEENKNTFYCIGSNYIRNEDVKLYDNRDGGKVEDFWKGYSYSPLYVKLLYDKYRKKYYRIAKHEIPEVKGSKMVADKLEAVWSVIVFDAEMNVEGEAVFPAKEYNFMDIHCIKEGILIGKSNPFRKDFKEEQMQFDLITLD